MTAINIMLTGDAAYLFCDTKASMGSLGAGNAVKCLPVPHINAAIATHGNVGVLAIALSVAANCLSFAEVRQKMGATLRDMKERQRQNDPFDAALNEDFDVFGIAFNDERAEAFAVFSHDKHGHPAWQPLDMPRGFVAPVIPESTMEMIAEHEEGVSAILAIMVVQAGLYPEKVGGHIHMTTIDAEGIHTAAIGKLQEPKPSPARNVKLPGVFAKYLAEAQ